MSILADSLELSVLMRVSDLHRIPLIDLQNRLEIIREDTAQLLAEKGDILQFGGGKKGEVADIFNRVAESLALMAVVIPGGIKVFDIEFCYPHPELRNFK